MERGRACSGSSGAADPLVSGFQCWSKRRSKSDRSGHRGRDGRGITFCGPTTPHCASSHLLGLWDPLPLRFPCFWKVSREVRGGESVRNNTEEIFPWSLGPSQLLGSAPSLGFELGEAVPVTGVSGELAHAKKLSVHTRLQRGIPFLHHGPVPVPAPALHPLLLFDGSA